MRIAIVGAGFAGLASARVLGRLGHSVVIYEKAPDIGGVWSATRRYPGLCTQNDKRSYALSELPMPADYPEWPDGEQVQNYLVAYAETFGLLPKIHLNTEVVAATPRPTGGWDLSLSHADDGEEVDHLVIANGIFSRPHLPDWEGRPEFDTCGGTVLAASDLHSVDQVHGKDVVVVGYGKSACDVAVDVSSAAASTTVIARNLLWKMPRKLLNVLNNKYLMNRLGENLFRYRSPRGFERLLNAGNAAVSSRIINSLGPVIARQYRLDTLGLRPPGTFDDIGRSTFSIVTEGFFEGVSDGTIAVRRDTEITRLLARDGRPHVEVSDGAILPADIVIGATGFDQEIPFLPAELLDTFTDDSGDLLLHRQIHPIGVPDLSFAGYNSSFVSGLSAETAALWIGSLLAGHHRLPSDAEMRIERGKELDWMRERTRGKHARGTNIVPFSIHNIDETLDDIELNLSPFVRAKQWMLPLDPGDYSGLLDILAERIGEPVDTAAGARPDR